MKVLFVTREYPPFEVGGIARHTYNLVKQMMALGVKCRVISFGEPSSSSEIVSFIRPSSSIIMRTNAPIYQDAKVLRDIASFTATVNRLLAREQFDVVHVEEPYVGAFVAHGRKVTTIQDTSYGELRSILNSPASLASLKRAIFFTYFGIPFERACASSSKAIIAGFEHIKEELMTEYGIKPEKIRVIGNGVELPPETLVSKTEGKRALGLPDKPLILSASQHVARKHLETLIEACRLLKQDGVRCQVIVSGDGPLRQHLGELVKSYRLEDMVTLPGWVPREKLNLFYEAADIFVLTSEYEAGPITLLEAMSYGSSVVSTRIGGFASRIRDGVDGLLFPVGDYKALAACLERALGDEDFLQRSSSLGSVFAKRFDWRSVAKETLALYQEIA